MQSNDPRRESAPTVRPVRGGVPGAVPEDDLHALLVAWHGGDRCAGERLWQSLAPRLTACAKRHARRVPGLGLEAEDLLQEAAASLVVHRERLVQRPSVELAGYLARTIRNVMCDALRRAERSPVRGSSEGEEDVVLWVPCPRSPPPDVAATQRELGERLGEGLADLCPRLAEAVWLGHALDHPWGEVAAAGGWCRADSARIAVTRAVRVLRGRLAILDDGPVPFGIGA